MNRWCSTSKGCRQLSNNIKIELRLPQEAREETYFETPRTQTEMLQTQTKGKAKIENNEPSYQTLKDVDQKLVRAVQMYQKKQEEDYGLDDASSFQEVLVETFPLKFKLPSSDKYNMTSDPKSHLAIFKTTISFIMSMTSFMSSLPMHVNRFGLEMISTLKSKFD